MTCDDSCDEGRPSSVCQAASEAVSVYPSIVFEQSLMTAESCDLREDFQTSER